VTAVAFLIMAISFHRCSLPASHLNWCSQRMSSTIASFHTPSASQGSGGGCRPARYCSRGLGTCLSGLPTVSCSLALFGFPVLRWAVDCTTNELFLLLLLPILAHGIIYSYRSLTQNRSVRKKWYLYLCSG